MQQVLADKPPLSACGYRSRSRQAKKQQIAMVEKIRNNFNEVFTTDKYNKMLKEISLEFNHVVPFRIAETPVFIPKYIKNQLLQASGKVVDFICSSEFDKIKNNAIPNELKSCKNIGRPNCLAIDFAIIKNEEGDYQCKLIELQAALSLFGFTELLAQKFQKTYPNISNLNPYLSNLNSGKYTQLLRETFSGKYNSENVIFLEISPQQQQNKLDYIFLEKTLGIKTICISEVIIEGKNLFYKSNQNKIPIYRIVNRVILEELYRNKEFKYDFSFNNEYNVDWVNHPVWFFTISKFLMPHVQGMHFPKCFYLDNLDLSTINLAEMILKPIFSLGGKEIIFNLTKEVIEGIDNKENYILQEKVEYDFCIKTTNEPVRTEIRVMYIWQDNTERPIPVMTFSRFTRGNQMALKYNKNEPWVGASTCFFES